MATPKQWAQWNKDMIAWVKKLTKWQKAHETIDWLPDLCNETKATVEGEVTTESHGGEHPPLPPPKP